MPPVACPVTAAAGLAVELHAVRTALHQLTFRFEHNVIAIASLSILRIALEEALRIQLRYVRSIQPRHRRPTPIGETPHSWLRMSAAIADRDVSFSDKARDLEDLSSLLRSLSRPWIHNHHESSHDPFQWLFKFRVQVAEDDERSIKLKFRGRWSNEDWLIVLPRGSVGETLIAEQIAMLKFMRPGHLPRSWSIIMEWLLSDRDFRSRHVERFLVENAEFGYSTILNFAALSRWEGHEILTPFYVHDRRSWVNFQEVFERLRRVRSATDLRENWVESRIQRERAVLPLDESGTDYKDIERRRRANARAIEEYRRRLEELARASHREEMEEWHDVLYPAPEDETREIYGGDVF